MKDQNLVSIVISAYNAENTIVETLESVVAQTYENIETIIVDDGSTDGTLELVKQSVKDKPSMHVYAKENEGVAAARNYGFQYVKGKYLLFLDADDLIDSRFVELSMDIYREQPEVDIVTTQIRHFERVNNVFAHAPFSLENILKGNCFVITSMIKSDAFKEIGMFDVSMPFHEDWEMWIRMTEKYNNVVRIDEPLFWYRKRSSEDSLCDLNDKDNISDQSHFYLYTKHYKRFLTFGYGIQELFKLMNKEAYYRKKYNGIWYRKLFYKLIKKRKLD